jgi:cytochrome P450
MLSVVCSATLPDQDPEHLLDDELQYFFSLLWAAGADTTRNAMGGGLLALTASPDQFDALRADRTLLPAAVEEIVRWTHPASYNRRTATRATELGGHTIAAGAKVVFWEASANRDERVFADPDRFDVARAPNDHVAFGGYGAHFCLGASLARLELRVMFEELLAGLPDLALEGGAAPALRPSNFIVGIEHMPVSFASF